MTYQDRVNKWAKVVEAEGRRDDKAARRQLCRHTTSVLSCSYQQRPNAGFPRVKSFLILLFYPFVYWMITQTFNRNKD
jgi:hypothetical protein